MVRVVLLCCVDDDAALESLRQLMTVSAFVDYVKTTWVGEGTVPFDMHLRSLLITPVQRVPR